MATFLTLLHVITCALLILVVLIQSGKGAEISASFGGSSQTVFGSSGGANFFTKFTAGAAAVFMVTSVALTIQGARHKRSVFTGALPSVPAQTSQPGVPAGSPPAGTPQTATQPANPVAPGNAASGAATTAPAQGTLSQPATAGTKSTR